MIPFRPAFDTTEQVVYGGGGKQGVYTAMNRNRYGRERIVETGHIFRATVFQETIVSAGNSKLGLKLKLFNGAELSPGGAPVAVKGGVGVEGAGRGGGPLRSALSSPDTTCVPNAGLQLLGWRQRSADPYVWWQSAAR